MLKIKTIKTPEDFKAFLNDVITKSEEKLKDTGFNADVLIKFVNDNFDEVSTKSSKKAEEFAKAAKQIIKDAKEKGYEIVYQGESILDTVARIIEETKKAEANYTKPDQGCENGNQEYNLGHLPANIYSTDSKSIIEVSIPGVSKDRISVDTEIISQGKKLITVSIRPKIDETSFMKDVKLAGTVEWYQISDNTKRSFTLIDSDEKSYDIENINSKLVDGVLIITVPVPVNKKTTVKKSVTIE